jgi:hypothetical protein
MHEAASVPGAGMRAAEFETIEAGEGFDGIGRSPGVSRSRRTGELSDRTFANRNGGKVRTRTQRRAAS